MRYTKLKDGWIHDNKTKLEWGPSSTERMAWAEAKIWCKQQGGRLPEIQELVTLVDYSRHNPAIDPIFGNTQSSYYWSSTTFAYNPSYAWDVGFSGGFVYYVGKTSSSYVRPVRSGQ